MECVIHMSCIFSKELMKERKMKQCKIYDCGVIVTILLRKSSVLIYRLSNCTGIGTSKIYGVFRWRKAGSIRIGCQHIRWDINLHLNCFRHFSLSRRLTITYVKYKGCITFCKSHLNKSKRSSAITNWCILNPRVSNWILQDMIANEQIYCMVSIHRLLSMKFIFLNEST